MYRIPLLTGLLLAVTTLPTQAFDFFDREVKTEVTSGQDSPTIDQVQSEAYDGPKARVAVSRFTNKSHGGWYSRAIGDGMADQLVTALFSTGRYIVLERQTLGDVLAEQDLGASGRIRQETAAPIGEIEGAELLITGAVTEFEANAGGTRGGAGGLFGGVVGAIAGSVRKAHMAIDVRVIDARTSRIVAATSVQGESSDVNLGGAVGTYFGGGALGGALQSWKNTPKEKALRACIQKAVEFIVSKTPRRYFHQASQTRTAAAAPAAPKPAARAPVQRQVPQYAAGTVVRISSSKLNVRSGPNTGNPVVFQGTAGMPLLVQGQQGNWLQVRSQTGLNGWTAGWLVQADPAMSAASFSAPATAAAAPAKTAKPAGGDTVARLSKLKKLYDQGLITEEEYDAKRKKILESL